ncbi:hypothetical protein [Escherichia coli]|uniref:hypothetical protein n=1 Tax=Escherichia coli TaxID=562 RepID=UPI00124A3B59|nr:hypothetical protein [Escherichia coli]EFM9905943.1 hypothetical protein [Escherichia coli]EID2810192.1 hypothetical protein [Escherichia coli]EIH3785373.1 hypothetical protein [Escherichia coli]KAA8771589.1 hypothetical protein F3P10_11895 [Escherichia coli]MCA7823049.1 hypothetical protein [Escherichia coli]
MKKIIYFSLFFIGVVILAYIINFNAWKGVSKSTEVWAQFGDYLGGVVNPILTFLSIVLLIKSVNLQREANSSLIIENKRQEHLDYLKNFEARFYSLIDAQRNAFEKFKLTSSDGKEVKGGEAVNFLEDVIFAKKGEGCTREVIAGYVSECDVSESIHSSARRFYLLLKLIDEKLSGEEKTEYYEVLLNLTDFPLVRLMVLTLCLYEWHSLNYIESSGVLDKVELNEYKAHFKL